MSVMIYSNGAWQEASETPKKYVSGAWEDSDGYAYENGAWVEKWANYPSNYIIKDGVVNPNVTLTSRLSSGNSTSILWQYDATEKALYSSCVAKKQSGTTDFDGHIEGSLSNISVLSTNTVNIQYKTATNKTSGTRYFTTNIGNNQLYSRNLSATSKTTVSYTANTSSTTGIIRNEAYNTASSKQHEVWIYNLWIT